MLAPHRWGISTTEIWVSRKLFNVSEIHKWGMLMFRCSCWILLLLWSFQTPLIIYMFHFLVDYAEITFMVSLNTKHHFEAFFSLGAVSLLERDGWGGADLCRGWIGNMGLGQELPGGRKRGRTQRRFRDVVREDVSDRVTWRQMIVTTPKEEVD